MKNLGGVFFSIDEPLYIISTAARLTGMHPQTLRAYDRLGLVSPNRTTGKNRRYSLRDIASLRKIQSLVNEGINLAGIARIMELENNLEIATAQISLLKAEINQITLSNSKKDSRALVRIEKYNLIR
jgi:MerR family transcriptional regulator, heat shock protein HspR